jgi:hypothetical protein
MPMHSPARVLTSTTSKGPKFVANASEFRLNLSSRDDVPVWQVSKIKFDARTKEPVEWRFVDGHHGAAVDVSRVVVDRCVHMGPVVGREFDQLESPTFAVR